MYVCSLIIRDLPIQFFATHIGELGNFDNLGDVCTGSRPAVGQMLWVEACSFHLHVRSEGVFGFLFLRLRSL